ncbi:MAG: glycosyltransferase family 4 protein [Lepagella sp.]
MKVLIVHNEYGKYSGEEAVVDRMVRMYGDLGYEVAEYRRTTAGSRESLRGKIAGFASGIYSRSGVKEMGKILDREHPDVVNVHNLYPFISPAALWECKRRGIPVVMTIHNFRLMCPTGLFMRDNAPCELCRERHDEWGCVRHNCEHSMLKSIGYALRNMASRWRKDYLRCVDRFACITDFQRQKLISYGYPSEKIVVIPNTIETNSVKESERERESVMPKDKQRAEGLGDGIAQNSRSEMRKPGGESCGRYVAYSGRISREKGVDMIVEVARRHPEIRFKFAGSVRDPELVETLPENVEMVGFLSGKSLAEFYKNSKFFVMASRWYEGFPMTILEVAEYGKPMIGPAHGGFVEIIGSGQESIGVLFEPSNIDSLEEAIVGLWGDESRVHELGVRAYEKLQREYRMGVISQKWSSLMEELGIRN